MIVALLAPHLTHCLLPFPPSGGCGILQQALSMGRLQQVVQPAQTSAVTGFHETLLPRKVRNQQFVHQVHKVGTGIPACQSLLLLEAVDQRNEDLQFLHRVFVDDMKEVPGSFQTFFRRNRISFRNIFSRFIIIIYIIFPILRKGVNEYPLLLAIITAVLYILSIVLGAKDVSLFVKLPEFLFGMYFIKFIKKPNLKMALISLVIVVINTLVKPDFISVVQCTYVGIASFVCLAYVSELLQFDIIQKICKVICKYSYPCFIVHHFIIYRMVEKFNLDNITMGQNYLLFACCIVVIAVFSYLLLHVNDKVVQLLKKEAK